MVVNAKAKAKTKARSKAKVKAKESAGMGAAVADVEDAISKVAAENDEKPEMSAVFPRCLRWQQVASVALKDWPHKRRAQIGGALFLAVLLVVIVAASVAAKSNGSHNKSSGSAGAVVYEPPTLPPLPPPCVRDDLYCHVVDHHGQECACANAFTSLLLPLAAGQDPSLTGAPNRVANVTWQDKLRPPVHLNETMIGNRTRPLLTNAWWGNLIIRDDNGVSNPVFSHPYRLQFKVEVPDFGPNDDVRLAGLHVSHPYQYRIWGPDNDNSASSSFYHWFTTDLILSAQELTPSTVAMIVTDWDDAGFGVSARVASTTAPSSSSPYFETHLVQGMALVTMDYHLWTPRIGLTERRILSVTKDGDSKWVLELDNDQHWVVYSSSPIAWKQSEEGLTATQVFTGTLRIAKLPDAHAAHVYDPYRDCVVVGGDLHVPDSAHYAVAWRARGDCRDHGMVHYALPHHRLDAASGDDAVPYRGLVLPSTTRGDMQAYVSRPGSLWRFDMGDDYADLDFLPPKPLTPELRNQTGLLSILAADIVQDWDVGVNGSYYYNGKAMQKYATLCLMANQSAVVENTNLFDICVNKLKLQFGAFVDNSWKFPLVYDEIYGGVVSSEGFVENSTTADFGNTVYNDHHYHWGYWIVASAILRHLVPDWERRDELAAMVNLLVRDAANPSADDPWFPAFRMFDWYYGHSLSRGVTPSGDGKDQESASEEMNFHYGLFLWGRASGNVALEQLGQLMLKVNSAAIATYFLFTSDSKVIPERFIPNKVSGIFFDNKMDYNTWFCGFRECIHGIQMLPVSPVSPIFRSRAFVQEEWDDVLRTLPVYSDNPNSTWISLIYANLAHIDSATALEKLATATLDPGLSRSWALYYAAVQY